MTANLHSAVRTAVDEARRLAEAAEAEASSPWGNAEFPREVWNDVGFVVDSPSNTIARYISAWHPRRALAMCDWADDVLRRHAAMERSGMTICRRCSMPPDAYNDGVVMPWPCAEVRSAAAAFGVETGDADARPTGPALP